MPLKDLKEHYGIPNAKTPQAVNRAIREECPGGGDVLDLMTLVHQIGDRTMPRGWAGGNDVLAKIFERLLVAVDAMEDSVRERWGLPDRGEPRGPSRGSNRRGS